MAKLRQSIEAHVPAIIEQLVERAKKGDAGAAKLLLERVIPPMKAVEAAAAVALPEGDSLAQKGAAVLEAVATGALAPGQGAALLTSLGTLAKLIETDELAQRIAALEERTKS